MPLAPLPTWRPCITALGVAVLTALAWLPGIEGPYHFDDYVTPVRDPASASLADWRARLGLTLRPLTKLTYALEAEAGLQPTQRRGDSVVLHALAAALLSLLLSRLAPGTPSAAAALALPWALHPVHAEAVLAIAGRSTVASNALVFGALLAASSRRWRLALGVWTLAVLARETALAAGLPLAVLAALERRPRGLVGVGALGLGLLLMLASVPRYRELTGYSFDVLPLAPSLARQLAAIPIGAELFVRVDRLSADHGWPLPASCAHPLPLLGVALLGAMLAATALLTRRGHSAAVAAALWLAAVLPVQALIPRRDPLTERPLGLALAALAVLAASAVHRWPARAPVVALATLMLGAPLTLATERRGRLYASDLALWADAASKAPAAVRPHFNYALALIRAGDYSRADAELAIAQRIDPWESQVSAARHMLRSRLSP